MQVVFDIPKYRKSRNWKLTCDAVTLKRCVYEMTCYVSGMLNPTQSLTSTVRNLYVTSKQFGIVEELSCHPSYKWCHYLLHFVHCNFV